MRPLSSGVVGIRLIIAEDNYLVREGVTQLLQAVDDVEVVAVCEDFDALVAAVDSKHPDVVLTDIRMPPTNSDEGIRLAERLRESSPGCGVVVLSQYLDAEYALKLLGRGAAGRAYLLKERVSNLAQMLNAIREVAAGGSVIDTQVVEELIATRQRRAESPLRDLTPREHEVLAQVAQGKNNAAIASALFLSEPSMEKHINSIFSKLGVSEEQDVNRRVRVVLMYLAERGR